MQELERTEAALEDERRQLYFTRDQLELRDEELRACKFKLARMQEDLQVWEAPACMPTAAWLHTLLV